MKSIYYAKDISELLYQLKTNKGLQVVGGCTKIEEIPEKFISTKNIYELNQITRHERFIDIGPGATISKILHVGQNHLPPILYEAMNRMANPMIRNSATIGGNICYKGHKLTLYAPLLALDAKLEFKNQNETVSESLRNFKEVPEGFILTNIRVPLIDAEVSIFRRIGPEHAINLDSASFAFIADTERNSIAKVQMAFAGAFTFHSKNIENSLIGEHLPLTQTDINRIYNNITAEFYKQTTDQMISDVVRQQFFNLARYSLEQLT